MINLSSKMFEESKKSTASDKIIKNIIAFVFVFIVIMVAESAIPVCMSHGELKEQLRAEGLLETTDFNEMMKISTALQMKPIYFIPSLFCTGFGTIISIVYCRFIEARYVRSMGVRKEKSLLHYAEGFGVGILLMTSIVGISAIFRINKVSLCQNVDYGLISLYFLGFLFQGMSEEFIFRGYLMTTIGARHRPVTAILISAAAFSLCHLANPGFNFLVFINLSLFGIFAAVYMIFFEDIWGVCAIHSIWNFTQGNFYGISVSGTGNSESVFRTEPLSSSVILTGGDFGIEGSIVTTFVLTVGTVLMLYGIRRRDKN